MVATDVLDTRIEDMYGNIFNNIFILMAVVLYI